MSTTFWDFDGTLVYSEHLWSGSMYKALQAVDPHTHVLFSQIRECNRRGFTWQTAERDHSALTHSAWWEHMYAHFYISYLSCGVAHETADAAAMLVHDIIKHPENYKLFDDTIDTLCALRRAGHRHVLLSNNYPDLPDVLDALGLSPLLDGVILSACEGYDKPRQELFALAKERFPSKRYYMVGDNPHADILGGHQASMTTILVHRGASPLADHCTDTLLPIADIVK